MRERVQYRLHHRRIARAKIVDRLDEAMTDEVRPQPIHERTGEARILPRRDPIGDRRAPIVRIELRTVERDRLSAAIDIELVFAGAAAGSRRSRTTCRRAAVRRWS